MKFSDKFACFAAFVCLVHAAEVHSQQPPAFSAVEGSFFALSVPDIESSVRWYSEKLGLRVSTRFADGKIKGALMAGNGLEVELIAHEDAVAPGDPTDMSKKMLVRGIAKVGIRVPDFDGTMATLRQRGVPIAMGPFPARKDQRANALIQDNAGNLIQFFGDFAK